MASPKHFLDLSTVSSADLRVMLDDAKVRKQATKAGTADTPLAGKPVRKIKLPRDAALVTILRGGRVIVPQGDDTLEAGDELLFVATAAVEEDIRTALGH